MNAHESLPGKIGIYKLNVTNLARGTMYEVNVQAVSEVGESAMSTVKASTRGWFLIIQMRLDISDQEGCIT